MLNYLLNYPIVIFMLLVLSFSIIFMIFGSIFILKLSIASRLHKDKTELGKVELDRPIPRGTPIEVLCLRLLRDFIDRSKHQNVQRYFLRTFGDIVVTVHYHERNLKNIIKELQTYAFLIVVLGGIGLFKLLIKVEFVFNPHTFLEEAAKDPFHVIALFEFLMLLLFLMRLIVELRAIKEILED